MTPGRRRGAARFLAQARLHGPPTPAPPPELTPETVDEGYAVLDAVHEELEAAGFGARVGHKIGCTTPVMQAFLGIDHPCAGAVFASTVFPSGAERPLAGYHRVGVECEIAARLAADLPARDGGHTRDSVADAVGALMAGIELVDDRYVDYPSLSAPTLIADDFFNAGVVLGPEVPTWSDLDLEAVAGVMVMDGAEAGRGRGADILGHPLNALAWLADHQAARNAPLRAGEFVMLGSVVKTVFVDAPATVDIRFDGLGAVWVRFV